MFTAYDPISFSFLLGFWLLGIYSPLAHQSVFFVKQRPVVDARLSIHSSFVFSFILYIISYRLISFLTSIHARQLLYIMLYRYCTKVMYISYYIYFIQVNKNALLYDLCSRIIISCYNHFLISRLYCICVVIVLRTPLLRVLAITLSSIETQVEPSVCDLESSQYGSTV